ncbi:probable ATP-dependent DNA helicase HFM1 [Stegodyphus dumicola]|uniref:probable ATP-dependent DNA helicase HFM1 n=1 Tax=Stegodyphus dumicola TaxID=202533 RepID=UPI0015A83071|nr:probable ATP-dependent DNA helicase HFM1 [Stegodyphus dumicola]
MFGLDLQPISLRLNGTPSDCLSEYLAIDMKGFSVLYNAIILGKCFKAKLWENSKHVSRQLDKIGVAMSTLLVNAGITTFESLKRTNPREIEMILNRNPPFGSVLIDGAKQLPQYGIEVEQTFTIQNAVVTVCITVMLANVEDLQKRKKFMANTGFYIIIGDADNNVLLNKKIM